MTAALILAALQLADAYTTLKALSLWAKESNPVMSWCFDHFGEKPTLIAKGIAVSGLGLWISDSGYEFVTWGLVVFYVAVVVNNVRVIRNQKRKVDWHPV